MIVIFKFNFRKKREKNRGKRVIWQVLAVWLALTVGVGVMGSAAALWYDSLVIEEEVNTGNIDPDFIALSVVGESTTPAAITLTYSGNGATITFDEPVELGYSATFNYKITNNGTVPISLKSLAFDSSPEVGIVVGGSFPTDDLDPGSSRTGVLTIRVDAVGVYDFGATLIFEQWNADEFSPLDGSWQETLKINGRIEAVASVVP